MLKLLNKNNKILQKNNYSFLDIYVLKLLLNDFIFSSLLNREKTDKKYNKFIKHNSLTYFRKICYLTNRPRSVSNLFRLSRFKIKMLAWEGLLVGLKRISW